MPSIEAKRDQGTLQGHVARKELSWGPGGTVGEERELWPTPLFMSLTVFPGLEGKDSRWEAKDTKDKLAEESKDWAVRETQAWVLHWLWPSAFTSMLCFIFLICKMGMSPSSLPNYQGGCRNKKTADMKEQHKSKLLSYIHMQMTYMHQLAQHLAHTWFHKELLIYCWYIC